MARREIERILGADNVDTARLSPGEVVNAMSRIERGRAPADFWSAYRAHVRAWQRLAAARAAEALQAEQAIESTFDEVERIARDYGARIPTPHRSLSPRPRR